MSSEVFSFSVHLTDEKSLKMVKDLKFQSSTKGRSFSSIVISGLNMYNSSFESVKSTNQAVVELDKAILTLKQLREDLA